MSKENITILKVRRQDGKLIMEIEEKDIVFLAESFSNGELEI